MSDAYHSRARLASVNTTIANRLLERAARKSINEVTQDYRDLLENLVSNAANGTVKAGGIAKKMRAAIIEDATLVYQEGMREGGIKDPAEEMDEADDQAIGAWITSQTPYIYPFADDAVAVAKLDGDANTAARDVMLGRVDTWVSSLEGLGRLGYASAKENQPGTWQLGKTEKHCDTCAKLDGQRHRLKWWVSKGYIPQQPGSETLDCGGWNCDCQIVSDDGERLL